MRAAPSLAVLILLLGCVTPTPPVPLDAATDGASDVDRSDAADPDDAATDAAPDTAPDPDAGAAPGTVRFDDAVCFPTALQLDRVVPGDIDHDGRADVLLEYRGPLAGLTAPSGYGYARNLSSSGEVRFDARVDHLADGTTALLASRASQLVDLDGDGFAEALRDERWWRNEQGVAGPLTGATFRGVGQPFVSGLGFTTPTPEGLVVRDLDGDGRLDLASLQTSAGCNVLAYANVGSATAPVFGVQQIFRVYVRGLSGCTSLAVGDLDLDGRPDFVATSANVDRGSGEQGFAALRNETSPGQIRGMSFGAALRWTTAAPGERRATGNGRLADFNRDGRLDLFYTLTQPDAPGVRGALRLNTGASVLSMDLFGPAIDVPGDLGADATVSVVDLDGDGAPDLAAGVGDRVVTLQNLTPRGGAPDLVHFARNTLTFAVGSRAPSFADVDGDGRADVLAARDGAFCVRRNATPVRPSGP